jgi:hypothetical protein
MEKAQTGNEHRQVEQQEEGYLHAEKGVTVTTTFTREQVEAAIAYSSHLLLTKLEVHLLVTTTVNVSEEN